MTSTEDQLSPFARALIPLQQVFIFLTILMGLYTLFTAQGGGYDFLFHFLFSPFYIVFFLFLIIAFRRIRKIDYSYLVMLFATAFIAWWPFLSSSSTDADRYFPWNPLALKITMSVSLVSSLLYLFICLFNKQYKKVQS